MPGLGTCGDSGEGSFAALEAYMKKNDDTALQVWMGKWSPRVLELECLLLVALALPLIAF